MTLPSNAPLEARLCANCIYFDPHTELGLCRLNPPQRTEFGYGWPTVRPTDFCGQHHLRPSQKKGD